jgi:hypothetical protein
VAGALPVKAMGKDCPPPSPLGPVLRATSTPPAAGSPLYRIARTHPDR